MSTQRSTPLDDPPSASSDESETDDEQQQDIIAKKTIQQSSGSEESESESDSEEEEEQQQQQTPNLTAVKTPQTQNPNSKPSESSSSSESDSESESNENPKTKTLTVTPTKSSSIFEFESDITSPSASDFAIKPSKKISAFETPEKKATIKRHALASDVKDTKKAKILNGDTEDGKKSAFKRVWSDEDEINLLQGFLDYQKDNECSPLSDMDGFHRYSMAFIPGNATKSQLYEKVRRLKKKFRVNSEKVGPNGEDPTFVKPHEGNMFKLMKKIWGVVGCETIGNVGGSTAKSKVKHSTVKASKVKVAKVKPKMEVEMDDVADDVEDDEKVGKVEDFETLYPYWYAGLKSEVSASLNFPAGVVDLVKESFNLIGEDKAKEMNEKWKLIFEKEAALRKKRIALMCDVVRPLL